MKPLATLVLFTACGGAADTGEIAVPQAIVDSSRSTHFFDLPFPSDAQLGAGGHPDLAGFPVTPRSP